MFKHMALMRIPEAVVERELEKADEGGWELVSVVTSKAISGDRAVSMFFKKPAKATKSDPRLAELEKALKEQQVYAAEQRKVETKG